MGRDCIYTVLRENLFFAAGRVKLPGAGAAPLITETTYHAYHAYHSLISSGWPLTSGVRRRPAWDR